MRLWHYELIQNGLLPQSQLIAQWRELNSIFKNQPNHILINYIYEYSKNDLYAYTHRVFNEMSKRHMVVNSTNNYINYFGLNNVRNYDKYYDASIRPFAKHHTDRYLLQCFYNLQEKFDRGQKDFSSELMNKLENFISKRLGLDLKVVNR